MSAEPRQLFASFSTDSSFSDTASVILNSPTHKNDKDIESLALLSQIFPDEPMDELRRLHEERLLKAAIPKPPSQHPPILSDDFLRLPLQTAVRRFHTDTGKWEYQLVKDLQRRVLVQLQAGPSNNSFYAQVLTRQVKGGLGITLTEAAATGAVQIYAIHKRGKEEQNTLQAGDILLGVNGYALQEIALQRHSLLRQTVAFLKTCPSPVVLHLQKQLPNSTVSLLDTTLDESMTTTSIDPSFQSTTTTTKPTKFHPFASVLGSHGFLNSNSTSPNEEKAYISQALRQFTERARQWDFSNSFRIDAETMDLLPSFGSPPMDNYIISSPPRQRSNNHNHNHNDTPQHQPFLFASPARSETSSVSSLAFSTQHTAQPFNLYPGWRKTTSIFKRTGPQDDIDIFIPLMGVRKALSVRILNTFLDGDFTAYTIWVHDVESGREWYAPLRYFRDFQDLRAAALNLRPSIGTISFPSQGVLSWAFFSSPSEANDSEAAREAKCRQLEYFLRTLCTMIYTEELHPAVAEVAIHVQSFLGCDNALDGGDWLNGFRAATTVANIDGVHHTEDQWRLRTLLKRQLQMYAYRVFLLESMGKLVDHFVDTARANGPTLKEIEVLQAKSRNSLKKHAMEELKRIQAVMDRLQDLLVEGCMDDFRSIAHAEQFNGLQDFLTGKGGDSYLDRLVREAVREQVEIEVYLPLRGTTSRLLVNAWRHEDMEVSFKVQELRKRPQDFFPMEGNDNWSSVSGLLKNVSLSTLPCAKLRAIVDAATEISRLYRDEHTTTESENGENDEDPKHLGADDFLPIFIFCVIRAEMDRPCALCALLRTLCDPVNRMGEVGYYLASFEAAITHIREMDLSEKGEEMFSFLSIPLSDSSFG